MRTLGAVQPAVRASSSRGGRFGTLRRLALEVRERSDLLRHSVARFVPEVIRAKPIRMMIAVTARCNLRCVGCRYGRDFMPGQQLPLQTVKEVLDDAGAAGVRSVRLYGGEPLLHPDLPRMVEHARSVRVRPYVTTNAVLLDEKIDDLYAAGLRDVTIGYYGTGGEYDDYVQRQHSFARVERSVAYVRRRYGREIDVQINWLLMRPSANAAALGEMWRFAREYDLKVRVDLVHYSLPYFQEGPDRVLQFRPEDRPAIEAVVTELLRLKHEDPDRLMHSPEGLRSIPDWLLLGPEMKVPCTAYDLVWVGADGTVQLCYVTFKLGDLREKRLRDMLFTKEHHCFARDAFRLNCPNCHCSSNERIMRDAASRRRYSADLGFEVASEHATP